MTGLTVEINGQPFENFSSIEVRANIDTIARSFSIDAAATAIENYPIKPGDSVVIKSGNTAICTGYVDRTGVSYGPENHTISVTGRSKTADVVDSYLVAESYNFNSIKDLTEWILIILNINRLKEKIDVINKAGLAGTKQIDTPIPVKSGDNAFEFLEGIARKVQVILTDDGDGNICLIRNSGFSKASFGLNNKIDDKGGVNNIKRANASLDISNRYREYIVKAQQSTMQINLSGKNTEPAQIADQGGIAEDGNIRAGRTFVINAEKSMTDDEATDRALWQGNINRARSLTANVSVEGFTDTNDNPYDTGKLVEYDDDFTGISGEMLIDGIVMTYDEDRGSETKFRLIPPDAYEIEPVLENDSKEFKLQL